MAEGYFDLLEVTWVTLHGHEPAGTISVVIDQKDLRLVRPRVLKCLWWLIVGVSWLCL